MTKTELHLRREEALPEAVGQLLEFAQEHRLMVFIGEIGAGKTTFIKVLCQQLGVKENVSSPSFSLVNQYSRFVEKGISEPVYHIDLYRIKTLEEAWNIGIEEYIDSPYYTFVEWPELILHLLPKPYLQISISPQDDSSRKIVYLLNT